MKNSLERFNSIFELVKENINKLENRSIEINQSEEQQEKRNEEKHKQSLRQQWNTIKSINICIRGVPGGEEREIKGEKIFENIMSKFPNLMKPKTAKDKAKILRVAREMTHYVWGQ